MSNGLVIAAPASGSGKTTITLGILHALAQTGLAVRGAKSGPDYIDPRFHEAACGAPCLNLDAWAMSPARIRSLAAGPGLLVVEGAMGLFDGAPPAGKGATADIARILNAPVVLVVDAASMAQSVAALVSGFARHDPLINVAGIILNKIGSPRHETMLRNALTPLGIPVIGAVPRQSNLTHPSRHLGLVQAGEHPDLQAFLTSAGQIISQTVDLDALTKLAKPLPPADTLTPTKAPARRIAVARDAAFAFSYPHLLDDWRKAGAEITYFSPLANQAPPAAELIFLPGGYPELHAKTLASADKFHTGMQNAAQSATIYGECGGYMVLGRGLTDAQGTRHEMLGLLDLETSFAQRKLHLGYRDLTPLGGPFVGPLKAHEFHYATTLHAAGNPLFHAADAQGNELGKTGLTQGNVSGSFAHLIDLGF